jgi:PST family polysaccharide transporter
MISMVFCGLYLLPFWYATAVGVLAAILSGVYSLRVLVNLVSLERIPRPLRWFLVWFRVADSGS